MPVIGRFFPAPVAAKVPEVIFLFWVVKILTTAGGEATSDYLKTYGNFKGGGIEVGCSSSGSSCSSRPAATRAFAYWFFAYAIAVIGTGVSDFLHLDVGIPYAGTTLLWLVVLLLIFFSGTAARGRFRSTASSRSHGRRSTGRPSSPPSPSAPRSATTQPPR